MHFQPLAEDHIGSASDLGLENLSGDIYGVVTDVAGVAIRANRSLDMLNSLNATLRDVINRTNIVSHFKV